MTDMHPEMKLYNELDALTTGEDSPFYKVIQVAHGKTYHIFNYRIASYTDFCKPSALECRGIMFEEWCHPDTGEFINYVLVSRTPTKFFNLNENPFTMDLDFSNCVLAMDKADGSLISTYVVHRDRMSKAYTGTIHLKSKASLHSEQAVAAEQWLYSDHPDAVQLLDKLHFYCQMGATVNMEWVAPDNQIVLAYGEPRLIVLNARMNDTGDYIPYYALKCAFGTNLVNCEWDVDTMTVVDRVAFPSQVAAMEGIEGFVYQFDNGQYVKQKTDWYLRRHALKDNIMNEKKLIEMCLNETIDDVLAFFHHDKVVQERINTVHERTVKAYNHFYLTVNGFYETNKHLERKDYAIKGQAELHGREFGAAMMMYTGKSPDWKDFVYKTLVVD